MCLSQSFCDESASWFGIVVRSSRMRAESNSKVLSDLEVTWAGTNRLTAISGYEGVRRRQSRKGKCGERADAGGQRGRCVLAGRTVVEMGRDMTLSEQWRIPRLQI